ncbi:MAG: hypothetical protein AB1411_14565 [Nitrospirota bacterium]
MCPKCAGFLIKEDSQAHSGRFDGWRCIQCGLRLDRTIVQNRLDGQGGERPSRQAPSVTAGSPDRPSKTEGRPRKPAARA